MHQIIKVMPFLAFMTIVCGGCQGDTIAESSDPLVAREALTTILERWQAGDPPGPRDAELRFADEDSLAGRELTDFEIGEDHKMHGVSVSIPAVLSLRDARNKSIKKRVKYTISTNPSISVVRQD